MEQITLEGKLLFPSEYLSAFDLNGKDVTVEIEAVQVAELMMQGGLKKSKPLVFFKGAKKKLVLNKTNGQTIAAMIGGNVDNWPGNRITLFPTKVKCGRETVDAIRVRPIKPEPTNGTA